MTELKTRYPPTPLRWKNPMKNFCSPALRPVARSGEEPLGRAGPGRHPVPTPEAPRRRVRLLGRSFPIWRVADPPGLRPSPSRPSRQRILPPPGFSGTALRRLRKTSLLSNCTPCVRTGLSCLQPNQALSSCERTYSQPSRGVNSEAWESRLAFPSPPLGGQNKHRFGFPDEAASCSTCWRRNCLWKPRRWNFAEGPASSG